MPSILAAGRLGVEMRADADRQLRHVAALAQAEHRAQRIDMHLEAGVLAGGAKPVAHLLVLAAPASAAARRPLASRRTWRSREWCPRGGRNRSADWMAVGSCGSGLACMSGVFFNDAPAAVRQPRGCPAQSAGELGDALDRDDVGRGEPARRERQRRYGEVGRRAVAAARRPVRSRRSRSGITAMPSPSIAMWMTVASEALACSRIGGRSGRLNSERTIS